jgi:hypothetical protein
MANPTMTLIASNTVGSGGSASVTFSSIPATYTDLVVKIGARGDASGGIALNVAFNGSTSSFTRMLLYTDNGTSASSYTDSSNEPGRVNSTSTTSNTFTNDEFYIPNYTLSRYKSFSSDTTLENNATATYFGMYAMLWSQTAAITSITLNPSTGNFAQYSTFYLYGIKNS